MMELKALDKSLGTPFGRSLGNERSNLTDEGKTGGIDVRSDRCSMLNERRQARLVSLAWNRAVNCDIVSKFIGSAVNRAGKRKGV